MSGYIKLDQIMLGWITLDSVRIGSVKLNMEKYLANSSPLLFKKF